MTTTTETTKFTAMGHSPLNGWMIIGEFNSYIAAAEATDCADFDGWKIISPDGTVTKG